MRATRVPAAGPRATDLLTVGEIARRSGFTESAVRYYDDLGLLSATRTAGGQRRFQRGSLRRLALIRAARNLGLSLEEIAAALAALPRERIPAQADWAGLSDGLSAAAAHIPKPPRTMITIHSFIRLCRCFATQQ